MKLAPAYNGDILMAHLCVLRKSKLCICVQLYIEKKVKVKEMAGVRVERFSTLLKKVEVFLLRNDRVERSKLD